MNRDLTIDRDQAELLVDILEHNYRTGLCEPSGVGADLAVRIRELFGMGEAAQDGPVAVRKYLKWIDHQRGLDREVSQRDIRLTPVGIVSCVMADGIMRMTFDREVSQRDIYDRPGAPVRNI